MMTDDCMLASANGLLLVESSEGISLIRSNSNVMDCRDVF